MPTPNEAMEPVMAAVESYRACERLNTTGIPREYRDQASAAIRDLVIAELDGLFHTSMRCENYAPEHGGGPCDRCQRLAEWRAM